FLDEIGELPLNMQVKLLRVLQENKIQRIGGLKEIDVDVRVIAATNRDLEEMVQNHLFREDLYYRLNVVPIFIPPLRERKHDIVALLKHYIDLFNQKHDYHKKLDAEVTDILMEYDWPGNIRQLRNLVERLVVMSNHEKIQVDDLPKKIIESGSIMDRFENMSLKEAVVKLEKQMIENAYLKYGNVRDAAKSLDIDASTLVRKRRKHQ
ncbi:MAG: sigma 54-interacting transcriptional regulator, partial [Clostridia bacterium]|nr:sigma 54-interacting transcriptional regulator [Clostridia bacterium]